MIYRRDTPVVSHDIRTAVSVPVRVDRALVISACAEFTARTMIVILCVMHATFVMIVLSPAFSDFLTQKKKKQTIYIPQLCYS